MKKILLTLLICLTASLSYADSVLIEGFEYGNHDLQVPVGWVCNDNSWLAGYLDKDHNRIPHTHNWYAFTNADDSWMFMEIHMNSELKYRYYFWAISDGEYDVEFWAGSGPSSSEMTTMLFSKTVNSGEYQRFSAYLDTVAEYYPYFGIRAIAHEGAYYLTVDDIQVDMVGKYDFIATPATADTSILPNSQINHHFDVQNLGYEPVEVIMSPSHEYFGDIQFFVEGSQCTTFHLDPDETKQVTVQATLLPSVQAGTTCWLDIMLVLDCNCATAFTTLWVNVLYPAGIPENKDVAAIFPNPANDQITIRVQGLQRVEVMDITGKRHLDVPAHRDELQLDLTQLPSGIYFVTTMSSLGTYTHKLVVR